MHSERAYWGDGQHTEWCGAMIDSTHLTMHALARQFNLGLLRHVRGAPRSPRHCFLDGRYYAMTDADAILPRSIRYCRPSWRRSIHDTYANATATAAARRDEHERLDRPIRPHGLGGQLGG